MSEDYISREEHREFAKRIDDVIQRHGERLTAAEQALKDNTELTIYVGKLATSMESMSEELKQQGLRLADLENKDGEMWRTVVRYAVTAIIGTFVGFAMTQLGL